MKASSLVLTVGMIFFAVSNFTNTASGPQPTKNKISKGMTFHPFTQLKIKNSDTNKLQHQTTYKIPDKITEQRNHFIRTQGTKKLLIKPGKRLASRIK